MEAVLSTNTNQESVRIKQLLDALGLIYVEYRLGIDFSHEQFLMEFGSRADYPQAAIDGEHVGNIKAILRYFKNHGTI